MLYFDARAHTEREKSEREREREVMKGIHTRICTHFTTYQYVLITTVRLSLIHKLGYGS